MIWRMSRVVYLHIGAPKTGTTYVQDRLALNARSLARHDVHFPTRPLVSPGLFHFRAALDLLGQDWGGPPGHAEGRWDALVKRVRRSSGTVIVSHEILAPAGPERVARVMRDLADSEVHVVYSARDLARQLPAAWQESIKQGRKWSYRRFLDRVRARRALVLPGLRPAGGARHLGRRRCPPSGCTWSPSRSAPGAGEGDVLWLRFCTAFGIDPAWAPLDSDRPTARSASPRPRCSASSTGASSAATRREADVRRADPRDARPGAAGQAALRPGAAAPRALRLGRRAGREWIDWLEASGVDVVGDLEDLRPVRPAADERWRNPDKVRPRRSSTPPSTRWPR